MQAIFNNTTSIRLLTLKRLKHGRKAGFTLCITPMIDIIFLLLTFFVLTANFRLPEDFLSLKLPTKASQQSVSIIEPFSINITTTESGCAASFGNASNAIQIQINNDNINADLTTFAGSLLGTLQSQKRTTADPIEITCDDNVKWDHLVKIYNIINETGIQDVTFNINE